jgi:hypothetical protein
MAQDAWKLIAAHQCFANPSEFGITISSAAGRPGHDSHAPQLRFALPYLNSCRQIPARFLRYLVVFVEVELGAVFRRNAK